MVLVHLFDYVSFLGPRWGRALVTFYQYLAAIQKVVSEVPELRIMFFVLRLCCFQGFPGARFSLFPLVFAFLVRFKHQARWTPQHPVVAHFFLLQFEEGRLRLGLAETVHTSLGRVSNFGIAYSALD